MILIIILFLENSSPFCQFLDGCYCTCLENTSLIYMTVSSYMHLVVCLTLCLVSLAVSSSVSSSDTRSVSFCVLLSVFSSISPSVSLSVSPVPTSQCQELIQLHQALFLNTVEPRNTGSQGTNRFYLLLADFGNCQYRN